MLTKALCAYGIAIDTARLTGQTAFLWRRRVDDAGSITIDTGMAVAEVPRGPVYARIAPDQAVLWCIKHGMIIPWRDVAFAATARDSRFAESTLSLWKLGDESYINCHHSIDVSKIYPGAVHLETVEYVS